MVESMEHKCPACSANLPFNPETQTWHCDYCGKDYTLDQLTEAEREYEEPQKDTMNVDVYSCPNCGAQIITDENTTATFCVYCKSTAIIKDRLKGVLKPNKIIPFKSDKEAAKRAFKGCVKGKLFAPRDFNNEKNIDEITGVYIPFWLYDCDTAGEVSGTGKKITSWTSGDYRYEKTDTYSIARNGEMSFYKVPVDGSKKFEDDIMDSIEPFGYNELTDFSPSYLSGFLAEKYDVDAEEGTKRAKTRIENSIAEVLKADINGYTFVDVKSSLNSADFSESNYVLLPVWMLNINYKGKMRKFAMNGQTGKLIGDIPISWGKFFLYWVLFFLGSFGILTGAWFLFFAR